MQHLRFLFGSKAPPWIRSCSENASPKRLVAIRLFGKSDLDGFAGVGIQDTAKRLGSHLRPIHKDFRNAVV